MKFIGFSSNLIRCLITCTDPFQKGLDERICVIKDLITFARNLDKVYQEIFSCCYENGGG